MSVAQSEDLLKAWARIVGQAHLQGERLVNKTGASLRGSAHAALANNVLTTSLQRQQESLKRLATSIQRPQECLKAWQTQQGALLSNWARIVGEQSKPRHDDGDVTITQDAVVAPRPLPRARVVARGRWSRLRRHFFGGA